MPRQNRVTPWGAIINVTDRGMFMGNRGTLHDAHGRLISQRWTRNSWVSCLLSFKGRQRHVMTPGHYTELFFLDEATAFIDPENEALIQDAINKLIFNKTLIVIAHRISTIISADKILVLDKGRIAASGTHEQLLSTSKLYKNMWETHISAQGWAL